MIQFGLLVLSMFLGSLLIQVSFKYIVLWLYSWFNVEAENEDSDNVVEWIMETLVHSVVFASIAKIFLYFFH